MRSSCGRPAAHASVGTRRRKTKNFGFWILDSGLKSPIAISLPRLSRSKNRAANLKSENQTHSRRHQPHGQDLRRRDGLAEEEPAVDQRHAVADSPLESLDGAHEDLGHGQELESKGRRGDHQGESQEARDAPYILELAEAALEGQ